MKESLYNSFEDQANIKIMSQDYLNQCWLILSETFTYVQEKIKILIDDMGRV